MLVQKVRLLKASDAFCQIALPETFRTRALRAAGLRALPPAHPDSEPLLFVPFVSCQPHGFLKSVLLSFPFARLYRWRCRARHVFMRRLWQRFVRGPCRSLAEAPIFPLMIYKSAKCACSPDGGPAAWPPPWLPCRCARGGTSLHGHRCPGLSEERSGGSVAMVMLPKQAWHPSRSVRGFPGQPRQRLCRLRGRGEVGEPQGSVLCAPRQGWLQGARPPSPQESTV